MPTPEFCIFAHFHQPGRGNPLTGGIHPTPDAASQHPLQTATDQCYAPNARMGNFGRMSFCFSTSLLDWLRDNAPDTHQQITRGDRHAHGALATPYHDQMLPLHPATRSVQIEWGIRAFEHHFNRPPLGFFLPQMAVDTPTLAALATAGIEYVVLSQRQVHNGATSGSGPYRVALPDGLGINVFVRSEALSHDLSFRLPQLGGAQTWTENRIHGALPNHPDGLLLATTAGESFGLYHQNEWAFLEWLLNHSVPGTEFEVTTLGKRHLETTPVRQIKIAEGSSWRGPYGLSWVDGTHDEDTAWRGPFRRALAATEDALLAQYYAAAMPAGGAILRDYIAVMIGELKADELLNAHLPDADESKQETIQSLLIAIELVMRAGSADVVEALSIEDEAVVYALTCAALAASIAGRAQKNFEVLQELLNRIREVPGGTGLWNAVVATYRLPSP